MQVRVRPRSSATPMDGTHVAPAQRLRRTPRAGAPGPRSHGRRAPRRLVDGLDHRRPAAEGEGRRERVERRRGPPRRSAAGSLTPPDRSPVGRRDGHHVDVVSAWSSRSPSPFASRPRETRVMGEISMVTRIRPVGETKNPTLPDGPPANPDPMPTHNARSFRRLLPVLLVMSVLPGCFFSRSRTNPELSPELASQIVPNESTAADVTALLGAPNEVVQLGLRTAWRYEHTVEKQTAAFLVVLGLRGVDRRPTGSGSSSTRARSSTSGRCSRPPRPSTTSRSSDRADAVPVAQRSSRPCPRLRQVTTTRRACSSRSRRRTRSWRLGDPPGRGGSRLGAPLQVIEVGAGAALAWGWKESTDQT